LCTCTAEKKYYYKRRKRYEKRGSKGFFGRTGDGEDYYVLKGTATIDDNHERILTLKEGEHYFTPSGKGHSLTNLGEEELQVMALIIYDHEREGI
jgi:oxalate decarboxylase/phosphoglucose isomerase-like protein (cupin superfamily)